MLRAGLWSLLVALAWQRDVGEEKWWCRRSPGKCHGHNVRLVQHASFRMAQRLAAPFLVDWNGDGLSDLLVGEYDGRVRFFKQGTDRKFHFQKGAENPFRVIPKVPPRNGSYSAATVVAIDFDGDGKLEVILSAGGRISYFHQGRHGQLIQQLAQKNPFRRIRCGWLACRFHAADWDADGDIDLAVPIGKGVAFYENQGGRMIPRYGTENPFSVVLTKFVDNHRGWDGYYSSVCMADWDEDGDPDLLVGQADGSLLYFERLESGMLLRRFGRMDPFIDIYDSGHFYPTVNVGQLNKLSGPRLVIGDKTGKITVYLLKQDRRLRERRFDANPFSDLGLIHSPIPAEPMIDAKGDTFLMFKQATSGRLSLFHKTPEGRLVNITPIHQGLSKAVAGATWLEADRPQDVDVNGDGHLDRLVVTHYGQVVYQEWTQGVLVDKPGPDSPFYDIDLENGIEDAAVAGFLPIDWNGDGKMDLIVGAWGVQKLKYFEAGWCHLGGDSCNERGICDSSVGTCMCLTGYMNGDCSGCIAGHYTSDKLLTPEVAVHECLPCQGIGEDKEGKVCHSRGICMDDEMAWSNVPRKLNRLQRASYRGTGRCNCSEFFSGEDCSVGMCPPGWEYSWDHSLNHFTCHECFPGYYKDVASADSSPGCEFCQEGTYAPDFGSAQCLPCSGYLLNYEVDKDARRCQATFVTNVVTFSLIFCWGLIFWTLAFICGLPGVVVDIRMDAGQVHFVCSGQHLLRKHSRPVRLRFWGTGVPALETPSIMTGGFCRGLRHMCTLRKSEKLFPFKAHYVTQRELNLFDNDDQPIAHPMDASTGYFQVLPRHALTSTGFLKMPLLGWLALPVIVYVIIMALFASKFKSPWIALCLHVLLGGMFAALAHWLRWRSVSFTRLASDIQNFRASLLRKHRPKPCMRGPPRAVTARQLIDFNTYFQAYTGLRTTYYVAHNILKPITIPYQLSYAEVVGPSRVRWFVSHFWGTPFSHLIGSVMKHAEEAAQDDPSWVSAPYNQAYWICTFSNNQSSSETIQEELGRGDWSFSSFYLAMHSPSTVGTAMVFDDEAMPLTRSWCLFELLQTTILKKARGATYRGLKLCSPLGIMNNGSGSMDLALNVSRKLAHLRLQDAQASVQSDKEMIENLVVAEGGFDFVNMTLIEAVKEVLHAVQHSFTRTMQDLETDLAQRRQSAPSAFGQVGRSQTVSFGNLVPAPAVAATAFRQPLVARVASLPLSSVPGQAGVRIVSKGIIPHEQLGLLRENGAERPEEA